MKSIVILLALITVMMGCSKNSPYDTSADASADIQQALLQAQSKQQPLIIIFGANWCSDCQKLSKDITTGVDAKKIANAFQLVKVNVGNFDTNLAMANHYGNPISGGIPGAALLSSDGKLVYVTKPGELSTVRSSGVEGLYRFFKRHLL